MLQGLEGNSVANTVDQNLNHVSGVFLVEGAAPFESLTYDQLPTTGGSDTMNITFAAVIVPEPSGLICVVISAACLIHARKHTFS